MMAVDWMPGYITVGTIGLGLLIEQAVVRFKANWTKRKRIDHAYALCSMIDDDGCGEYWIECSCGWVSEYFGSSSGAYRHAMNEHGWTYDPIGAKRHRLNG